MTVVVTVVSPVTVMPVMMMMPKRNMEPERRSGAVNRRIHHRRRTIDHRRGLIDHSGLLHYDRLRVNDGGLRLHYDLLHHERRGLRHDDRRGMHVNWRCHVNRLRFESLCQQQASSHTCHYFSSGCPFLVAGVHSRDRTSENSQRCCHYQGSFHNLNFCSVGFDGTDARLFRRARTAAARAR